MKTCPKCQVSKPFAAFGKHKNRADGLQAYCRDCKSGVDKAYYVNNSDVIKGQKVHSARKYKYGLTEEAYNALLEQQGGFCACCGLVEPEHIDHDHSCCPTAKTCGNCVRGLLCRKCNVFIGYIEMNPGIYKNALEYLSPLV